MKKSFKRILASMLVLLMLVSSSVVTFADVEAEIELYAEPSVLYTYDGSSALTITSKQQGIAYTQNKTGAPFKAADDATYLYHGAAEYNGWGLNQSNHGGNYLRIAKNLTGGYKKLIVEMDVMTMTASSGISLRYYISKSSKFPGNTIISGSDFVKGSTGINNPKVLEVGKWGKLAFVVYDNTYEVYYNGTSIAEVNDKTLDFNAVTEVDIFPYSTISKDETFPVELYIDNIKVSTADDFDPTIVTSTVVSADEDIVIDGTKITGIPYGTTVSDLQGMISVENGTKKYVGDDSFRPLPDDAVIENDYNVASVSTDGSYTYYTTEVKYLNGDIYNKIIAKKTTSKVTVKNISNIADSAILIYDTDENGLVDGSVYTYYINNSTKDIECVLETKADDAHDIKVILVNNITKLANPVEVSESSPVTVVAETESGITVSGSASENGNPVFFMMLDADKTLDVAAIGTVLKSETGKLDNVYYIGGLFTEEGKDVYGETKPLFAFDTVGISAGGDYSQLVFVDDIAYTSKKFAPNTVTVKSLKDNITKYVASPEEVKKVIDADAAKGKEGVGFEAYKYYTAISSDDKKLSVIEDTLEVMAEDIKDGFVADDFARQLEYRSRILTMFNSDKAEDVYSTLDAVLYPSDEKVKEIIPLKNSTVDAYKDMTDSDKLAVCKYVLANKEDIYDTETLQAAIDGAVITSDLDTKVLTHSNVYNILKSYEDVLIGLDFDSYSELTSTLEDVNMDILEGRPYATAAEVISEANDLIDDAVIFESESGDEDDDDDDEGGSGGNRRPSTNRGNGGNISSSIPIIAPPGNTTNTFDDIADVEWAQEAINVLNKKGIVSGKGNKIFDPNGNVTREEFVKMIVETAGLKTYTVENDFTDVKADDWFAKYVSIAVENGIVNGIGDGMFGSGRNITRQDMMVMCMYLLPESAQAGNIDAYADAAEVADYAKTAVSTLVNLGIVNGDNGKLMPNANCTRAQAAKVIYMILKYNNQL